MKLLPDSQTYVTNAQNRPSMKKPIREGWWAEIVPLTYGRAQITVTDGTWVEAAW